MTREKSRAWRETDLSALAHNARKIQSALAPGCRLMAVVKANAYGHGALPVARRLEAMGIDSFAVACLEEGIALRRSGIQGTILILGYTLPGLTPQLHRWKLTQTVADAAHGQALAGCQLPLSVHLALDTGMHRLGIPAEDHNALRRLYELPGLHVEGVFSHLCVSDSLSPEDVAFTRLQLDRFYGAIQWLKAHRLEPGDTHIQASYSIWNLPPQPCSLARAGIALYGVCSDDSPTARTLDLKPVLSLRARVTCVRTLAPGEGAGYMPFLNVEGDIVHREEIAVIFGQMLNGDHRAPPCLFSSCDFILSCGFDLSRPGCTPGIGFTQSIGSKNKLPVKFSGVRRRFLKIFTIYNTGSSQTQGIISSVQKGRSGERMFRILIAEDDKGTGG